MPGFHVEHKLVDYNKWFEVFKPGTVRKEVQEDHGVSAIRILRDNEDPNHCIVVFEAPDRDSFEKFDSVVFEMLISILTGFTAGAIHVLGGADHLIAIAPSALNQPKMALKNGLSWGIGHSTGVLLLSWLDW